MVVTGLLCFGLTHCCRVDQPGASTAAAGRAVVPVPDDFAHLKIHDPKRALAWRLRVRRQLQDHFREGFWIVGFDKARGAYMLEKRP